MKISVRVKGSHPTGTYRRAGRVFLATAPTVLEERDLGRAEVEALAKDPWLVIEPVKDAEKPKDPGNPSS